MLNACGDDGLHHGMLEVHGIGSGWHTACTAGLSTVLRWVWCVACKEGGLGTGLCDGEGVQGEGEGCLRMQQSPEQCQQGHKHPHMTPGLVRNWQMMVCCGCELTMLNSTLSIHSVP
jgi:hypothetical protein